MRIAPRTYTIHWSRSAAPREIQTCRGLTGKVAFARLLNAIMEDRITVHSITAERHNKLSVP